MKPTNNRTRYIIEKIGRTDHFANISGMVSLSATGKEEK